MLILSLTAQVKDVLFSPDTVTAAGEIKATMDLADGFQHGEGGSLPWKWGHQPPVPLLLGPA